MRLREIIPTYFPIPGGSVALTRWGSAKVTANEPDRAVFLSKYDLAELLRQTSGGFPGALEVLAHIQENGHRFDMDDDQAFGAPAAPIDACLEPYDQPF